MEQSELSDSEDDFRVQYKTWEDGNSANKQFIIAKFAQEAHKSEMDLENEKVLDGSILKASIYSITYIFVGIKNSKHSKENGVRFDKTTKYDRYDNGEDMLRNLNIQEIPKNKFEENKYQVQSNFISNNSFEEIYGLEEDIGSLTPVKAKKVDETQFGIQKITTICEKKSEKDFNDLRMVQEFCAHTEAIWVATISPTNEYLATGGKDGDLNIWKINGADYIDDPFLLLDTRPFCTLNEQKDFDDDEKECDSILDISWCPKDSNFILSAHLNRKVVLWDIQNPEKPVSIYEHADTVSCVTFHPDSNATKMKFMTGCLDKTYQIWSKDNSEPIYSQQARDYVTALSISPDGVRAVVGLYTGQLIVCAFDDDKLNYITSIECKNRMGKYSNGTKVTSIVFLDNTEVLVTTNDSRIRIVSVEGRLVGSGTKQMKFKGHKNDNLQIGASINDENDFIICGSEDGYAYIWDKRIEAEGDLDKERNDIYEKFNPYYPDFVIPTSTFFAPSNVVQTFIKKYVMCQVPRVLKNIIIVTGFNGVIRVFHNSHFVR